MEALVHTAAALLDPRAEPPAQFIVASEPRDRLGPVAAWDPVRALPALAEGAGLCCVERHERRLTGAMRPDWETDVSVYVLRT